MLSVFLFLVTLASTGASESSEWNVRLRVLSEVNRNPTPYCTAITSPIAEVADEDPLCNDPDPLTSICQGFDPSKYEKAKRDLKAAVGQSPEKEKSDKLEAREMASMFEQLRTGSYGDSTKEKLLARIEAYQRKRLVLLSDYQSRVVSKYAKTIDLNSMIRSAKETVLKNAPANLDRGDLNEFLGLITLTTAGSLSSEMQKSGSLPLGDRLELVKKSELFLDQCGADGLSPQGIYDSKSIIICPAFLLKTFENGLTDLPGETPSVSDLDPVITHEMGHSIDSSKTVRLGPKNVNLSNGYSSFLKCVDDFYMKPQDPKFYSQSEVMDQIKNDGIPALQSRRAQDSAQLKKISARSRLREKIEGDIAAIDEKIADATKAVNDYLARKTLEDRVLKTGIGAELSGDYYAAAELGNSLKQIRRVVKSPQAFIHAKVQRSFAFLCEASGSKKSLNALLYGGVTEASHPPHSYRVKMALKNPSVREALGCKTQPPAEKPWCGLNGPAPQK